MVDDKVFQKALGVYDLVRHPEFNNWLRRPSFRHVSFVFLVLVCVFLTTFALTRQQSVQPPFAFRNPAVKMPSICTGYSILYTDAIATHENYLQRGSLRASDLAASKAHCDAHGGCLQVKLFDMNLYIGNTSSCYESRAQSLLMNLNMAVEQARMEGDILPNIDVYLSCHDRPAEASHAAWYISKSTDNVNGTNGRENVFLMPDFNFYSWPEAFHQPWRYYPRTRLLKIVGHIDI